MSEYPLSQIMAINRFRMGTDGKGISTLVAFYGCNLSCKYCLNPQCKYEKTRRTNIKPEHLVDILAVDDIYFKSTGGGVVFGGGEPLIQSKYISEVCKLMPKEWQKRIETSLNAPWNKIEILIPYINQWIIDIKDSNLNIYKEYAGGDSLFVYENVEKLSSIVGKDKLLIRIPQIPDYNTDTDIIISMELYSGFGTIDLVNYRKLNISI